MSGFRRGCFPSRRLATLLVFFALLTVPGRAQQARPRIASTLSTSGKFAIYSPDGGWRSDAARRSEAARSVWSKWIDGPGDSRAPIIINDVRSNARPKGNPRAVTAIYEGDGGALKIQIDVYDPSVMASEAFETEVFKALVLEFFYRDTRIKAGTNYRSAPAWVVEGLAEGMRAERTGTQSGVYAALVRSDRPPRIDAFLKQRPELMDVTSLTLYRTQALALTRALADLPGGRAGIGKFLRDVPSSDGSLKSLLEAFPGLGGDAGKLERVWTLAIARASAPRQLEFLSVAETARALDAIFAFTIPPDPKAKTPTPPKTGASALPEAARSQGGQYLMRQKAAELLALEMRAHPLLRPVISEYRGIVSELAAKPRRNVDRQLDETGKILALVTQRSGSVVDYLNWFEATRVDMPSDDFPAISDPPEAPQRTDAITRRLDSLEAAGW